VCFDFRVFECVVSGVSLAVSSVSSLSRSDEQSRSSTGAGGRRRMGFVGGGGEGGVEECEVDGRDGRLVGNGGGEASGSVVAKRFGVKSRA
jgi:hypothetical protein